MIHALSPFMAKSLSKRQRTEVRRIVQQEISPEWKCKEHKVAAFALDIDNAGQGISFFANIAQGLGPDDRVGRKIKVHRLDVWYVITEAKQPQLPGPIPLVRQLVRVKSSAGASPAKWTDRYNTALYPYPIWGPAPLYQGDRYGGNVKFYKLKRHWMAGLPMTTTSVWDRSTPGIYANSMQEAAFTTTGNVATYPAHNFYPNIEVPRSENKGRVQLYTKTALSWKRGLNVEYYDADAPGSQYVNFINMLLAYAADANSATNTPTHCAEIEISYRVWFTDA